MVAWSDQLVEGACSTHWSAPPPASVRWTSLARSSGTLDGIPAIAASIGSSNSSASPQERNVTFPCTGDSDSGNSNSACHSPRRSHA